ncbi:helix-turn-helix transcriptional regulator [Paraburkholderia sp. BR10872]|uniref:helix-turn-helix transcriptional regulator n=1 Tax=Paraburkholderia sp. BR10872 TaxID=3236989 RepID=UPI0034D175F3
MRRCQLTKPSDHEVEDYRRRLGDAILSARKRRRLTQKSAADAAGVTRQFFGLLERGGINVSLETLLRICSVLETTPALLFREVEQNGRSASEFEGTQEPSVGD